MRKAVALGLAIAGILVAEGGCKRKPAVSTQPTGTLDVHCAAGLRPPIEAIKAKFEKAENCTLRINYGGSGTLLGPIAAGAPADVFIPGDVWFIDRARERDLVESSRVAGWFVPVIGVQKGNPKGIKGIADLTRADLKVGLGRAEACAVGQVTKEMLDAKGLADRVKPTFQDITVQGLAEQVKIGGLDAVVIWDATATQFAPAVQAVPIEDAEFHASPFAAAVLKKAKDKALAQKFVDFLAGDAGAAVFREHHYQVPGKSIHVYCGNTFLDATNEIAAQFEALTGRKVERQYGDSGGLLLTAELQKKGDLYVCHDPFAAMAKNKGVSTHSYTTAYLKPVIVVPKGNPKNVKGLKDLLRPDLKVALPHRKDSTTGQVLWAIFKKFGMAEAMDAKHPVEGRTHGEVANHLKIGGVDVAVIWNSVARKQGQSFDIIPIEPEYKADAITSATNKQYELRDIHVTIVPLMFSQEPLLAAQFCRFAMSEQGRAVWMKQGFDLTP